MGAVRFDHVSITYPEAPRPTIVDLDATFDDGELALVVGHTGSGKSTLLRAVNGLVPHFSGGLLEGEVTVGGRSTGEHPPRELADVVGYVGQNPAATFVSDSVEEELAYGMENLGFEPTVMRRRVEEVVDLLGLHDLRTRPLSSLSGGQQQRVAIAAVLAAGPRVLVLDEPTSSLDPASAEDVLAAIGRLVHDVGLTVLLAEHRLERVVHMIDRVVVTHDDGRSPDVCSPDEGLRLAPVAPPIVELARWAGWPTIPRSVRDARRLAVDLRATLADRSPTPPSPRPAGDVSVVVRDLRRTYGRIVALDGVDLELASGQVTALMGRNGSGKSTLLRHVAGVESASKGTVSVGGDDPTGLSGRGRISRIGFVPQDPSLLLYGQRVDEECAMADQEGGLAPGTTRATLDRLGVDLPDAPHPRDLSEGQRLMLALAVVLAHRPDVVLLDEPTRGLDYSAKARLGSLLDELAVAGSTVVVATHDVELSAHVADRVIVLSDGAMIADGPARDVVCHSQVFAPQVAKILAPEPWLTLDEVRAELGART
jgi:energy-coupling factor transporter ATP-binding protein EcfA2